MIGPNVIAEAWFAPEKTVACAIIKRLKINDFFILSLLEKQQFEKGSLTTARRHYLRGTAARHLPRGGYWLKSRGISPASA
jgi:hypothetical protein